MINGERPVVSVVICTYNRRALLKECLHSLYDQTYPADGYEIIVVDDGSIDDTDSLLRAMAAKAGPKLLHLGQKNKGSATARNLGISQARGQIIASIDDDCVASRSWIENAVPHFADASIAGVQGKTLPADPVRLQVFPPRFAYTIEVTGPTWNRQTCNVFYRKQAILDVGGFDQDFGMTGAEDADLALRVEERGKIIFEPDAIVYHAVLYDTLANRLRFMKRFQYEPILFKRHPQLRKNLILGFVHSKEVVHVPFFVGAILAAIVGALRRATVLPLAVLSAMWILAYLWSNVLVDRNVRLFPIRMALFPIKLLLHSVKLYYHLVGTVRYRSPII